MNMNMNMSVRVKLAVLALVAALVASAFLRWSSQGVGQGLPVSPDPEVIAFSAETRDSPATETAVPTAPKLQTREFSGQELVFGYGSVLRSPAFTRWLKVGSVDSLLRKDQVTLHSSELHNGVRHRSSATFSTSWEMTQIATRTGDHLFVLGVADDAVTWILESWTVIPRKGEHFSERGPIATPVGVAATVPPLIVNIKGGTFVEPEGRQPKGLQLKRTQVWSGSGLGDITGLEADPGGRFVMVLSSGGSPDGLYLIENKKLASPVLLVPSSAYGGLSLEGLEALRMTGDTIFWIAGVADVNFSGSVVFEDVDNDGFVDATNVLSYDAVNAIRESATEDFVHYR